MMSLQKEQGPIHHRTFEERMKCAYLALAEENLKTCDDFRYVEAEFSPAIFSCGADRLPSPMDESPQ